MADFSAEILCTPEIDGRTNSLSCLSNLLQTRNDPHYPAAKEILRILLSGSHKQSFHTQNRVDIIKELASFANGKKLLMSELAFLLSGLLPYQLDELKSSNTYLNALDWKNIEMKLQSNMRIGLLLNDFLHKPDTRKRKHGMDDAIPHADYAKYVRK